MGAAMSDEREAFERWTLHHGLESGRYTGPPTTYVSELTQVAWEAWQERALVSACPLYGRCVEEANSAPAEAAGDAVPVALTDEQCDAIVEKVLQEELEDGYQWHLSNKDVRALIRAGYAAAPADSGEKKSA